jgi:hypothetical protein
MYRQTKSARVAANLLSTIITQPTAQVAGHAVLGVVQYFNHQRLREGSGPIASDFTRWLRDNIDKLSVAMEQVDEIIWTCSK